MKLLILFFCVAATVLAQTTPGWMYFGVNVTDLDAGTTNSGVQFNFEAATEPTATITLVARVDGNDVKIAETVQTDPVHFDHAGFVRFAIKDIDTLEVIQVTIAMGEYSGAYEHPDSGKRYDLARAAKRKGSQ